MNFTPAELQIIAEALKDHADKVWDETPADQDPIKWLAVRAVMTKLGAHYGVTA